MSVAISDLAFYGSANMPDADALLTGGAVDTAKRITFADMAANGTVNYVSSSASDTATTIACTGRDASGVLQTETPTLTGTTPVAGTQTFARLEKGVQGGTIPVGDIAALSNTAVVTGTAQAGAAATASLPASITLAAGQGASVAVGQVLRITNNLPAGVNFQLREIVAISADLVYVNRDWGTVPTNASTYSVHRGMLFALLPNRISQVRRPFYAASSDPLGGVTKNYYEKIFAMNNDTAIALTVASIIKQVDPSAGTLNFALTTALNDTGTVANRQTAPGAGITAWSAGAAPQTIAVPSPGNLPSGAAPNAAGAEGVWLHLQLAAGLAATNTSHTMRATGQTT